MKRSMQRLLTTHAGSITRSDALIALIEARDGGRADDRRLEALVRAETKEVVRRQVESGIDVISHGELGRTGFSAYADSRLSGFEPRDRGPGPVPLRWADMVEFPEYAELNGPALPPRVSTCTGPIEYVGQAAIRDDLAAFAAALEGLSYEEAFVPAATAGMVAQNKRNEYYASEAEFLFALADALHEEYAAIVDSGYLLQLDSPDLAVQYLRTTEERSIADYRARVALMVEAINRSLRGLAPERVRLHVCWGNYEGPHIYDVPLQEIVDIVLEAKVGAIYVEAANPRHAHEWRVWQDHRLPDGMLLIPGVVDSKTNIVEHPELVAERLVRFANLVGRENVIAGIDCGFGTSAARRRVYPSVQWAKLRALSEGAVLASRELWS